MEERRALFRDMEQWLDWSNTEIISTYPAIAEMVEETIAFRENTEVWELFAYTLMPNYLHLFLKVGAASRAAPDKEGSSRLEEPTPLTLETVLEQFKRWTGHRAAEILGVKSERFWEREWFDH